MNKKILVLFITFAFLTQMIVIADEPPALCVSSAQANAGQTVKVQLSLKNNPGIASMRLELNYDRDALKLVSVEDENILGTSVHGNDLSAVPYVICWANDTAVNNYVNDGILVVLTFQVNKGTEYGEYPVCVSYDNSEYDIFDVDFNTVDFVISNGIITVTRAQECAILNSTATICGGSIQVEAQLLGEIKGMVIFASYSNRLEDIKICNAAETVEALLEYKNADMVKVMWWDLNTLSPYAQEQEIKTQ